MARSWLFWTPMPGSEHVLRRIADLAATNAQVLWVRTIFFQKVHRGG